MSKRKEITIESRRRFKSFELPPYAKYDNFYPEGQANNDNQETYTDILDMIPDIIHLSEDNSPLDTTDTEELISHNFK